MEEKVVNFHFLLVYHSYLSDPVFGDPCAYGGGDEDLKEGEAERAGRNHGPRQESRLLGSDLDYWLAAPAVAAASRK